MPGIASLMAQADPILALAIARQLAREEGIDTQETQEAAIAVIVARKPQGTAENAETVPVSLAGQSELDRRVDLPERATA